MQEIPDIGGETAKAFLKYFEENRENVEKFFAELDFGFEEKILQKKAENTEKNEKIFGKSFCVTGSFEKFSRDEIHEMIEKNGGEVRSSVSAKLDFLIA